MKRRIPPQNPSKAPKLSFQVNVSSSDLVLHPAFQTADFVYIIGKETVTALAGFTLKFSHMEWSLYCLLEGMGATAQGAQRISEYLKRLKKYSPLAESPPELVNEFVQLAESLILKRNTMAHGKLKTATSHTRP